MKGSFSSSIMTVVVVFCFVLHDFSLSDDTTCDDASLARGVTCKN